MVFSDLLFLFAFIPLFVAVYLIFSLIDKGIQKRSGNSDNPMHTFKNFALIIFSLLFYAWGEPIYIVLMLVSVVINYIAGLCIGKYVGQGRKWALATGIALDLGLLCTFKYLNFICRIFRDCGIDMPDPGIALPIGISFYIFQSISYLVDVYRRDTPVQKNFWGLLLYISMFPQLIAGPIVRYGTVAEEIHHRRVSGDDISEGVFRFLIGLGKKVIIANQLGEIATDMLGRGMEHTSVAGAWIGLVCFSLQIYFDFSGYSDMAIGIGRCLGFHFNENFDHPYTSRTITEFWRRWHMSLGSFFRDYVYIPLGGNRRHQLVNIMLVWILTGLWHGASWNFVLWGLYFGIILLVEKHTLLKIRERVPTPLLHLYAIAIVVMGWALFYFDDVKDLGRFIDIAFGKTTAETFTMSDESLLFQKFWLLLASLVLCMPVRKWISKGWKRIAIEGSAFHGGTVVMTRIVLSAIILTVSVALLIGATNNAFLYTRF